MENQWQSMNISQIKKSVTAMCEEDRLAACATLLEDARKGVVSFAQKTLRDHDKLLQERARLKKLWRFEEEAFEAGYHIVIGTDEVGRGPLAGPVVAAAVILSKDNGIIGINDSKKLSEKRREALAEEIQKKALAYAIAEVSAAEIDRLNILHAAELAMKNAIEKLPFGDFVLIDGQNHLDITLASRNIIGGDTLSISIAAASIVAKVHRDHRMKMFDELYPQYGFAQNKGYPTFDHYEALRQFGPCPIHRQSFRLT